MTTSQQTYEDYIGLKSIFELDPPPTPDELESLGLARRVREPTIESECIYLCRLLNMRGHAEPSKKAKDMFKASDYFLALSPLENQRQIKQARAQPIDY